MTPGTCVYEELDATGTKTTIRHTTMGLLIAVKPDGADHSTMGFVDPRDLVHALKKGRFIK